MTPKLSFGVPRRWTPTGRCSKTKLAEARLAAHFAAQSIAAVAVTHLPKQDDDSHTNLEWLTASGLLAGHRLYDTETRVGLELGTLDIVIFDGAGERARISIAGHSAKTLNEAVADGLGTVLPKAGGPLTPPSYDMPDHPLKAGATFSSVAGEALAELAAWYDDAAAALEAAELEGASMLPVRCWPHHFDIATIVYLDDAPREKAPQVGVGMTPGDEHHDEPYYYVTPWPRDESLPLPPLESGGIWRPDGWFGAVLTKSALEATVPGDQQAEAVARFLTSAVDGGARIVRKG